MLVNGTHYRTVWMGDDGASVEIIDQRKLPWAFEIATLRTTQDACQAIADMWVRGAGCIGAVAGHGMFLAAIECQNADVSGEAFDKMFKEKAMKLRAARPTAVNLAWAVDRVLGVVNLVQDTKEKVNLARDTAVLIADEDAEWCRKIGENGLSIIKSISDKKLIA